jgi:hypothetical protein
MNEEFSGAWTLIESGAQALIDRFGEEAYLETRLRSRESPKQLMATNWRGVGRGSSMGSQGESASVAEERQNYGEKALNTPFKLRSNRGAWHVANC